MILGARLAVLGCETRAKAERLDDAREAADVAEARARERAAHAAARAGGG